ncbi:MAG TPA: alpha/beta fold hydrolase [Candidatus Binatia bacterium]|nr:alpha/beta fold hydrolase [Candidatus Binatia bacterium]
MIGVETLPAESGRYAAELLLVPALWAAPSAWRGSASYLAHRGWGCHLLDVRAVAGGVAARAEAVAEYARGLERPVVLVGHDAGGLVAAAAAARTTAAGVVLLAPVRPGSAAARALVRGPRAVAALVLGAAVPPPRGPALDLVLGGLAESARAAVGRALAAEPAAAVRDVAWGRGGLPARPAVPTLVAAGDRDALLPEADAAALAAAFGAERIVLEGVGHWPLAGPRWQDVVGLVHRWIVQRLGESLLELYGEAMADRDAEEDG